MGRQRVPRCRLHVWARRLVARPYGWAVIGAIVFITLIPRRMK